MVFQPHRYSRTKALWNKFVSVLSDSKIESLVITDIYSASEAPIENINSIELVKSIKQSSSKQIKYLPIDEEFTSIFEHLNSEVQPNDLILFLGAGILDKAAKMIVKSKAIPLQSKKSKFLDF